MNNEKYVRTLISIFIFYINISSCSFFIKNNHHKKIYSPTETYQKLLEYFEENNQDSLSLFFNKWENELQPFSSLKIEGLNDTTKTIYNVFNTFYITDPKNFIVKYIILQNSISYSIIRDSVVFEKYTFERGHRHFVTPDTLFDFRPYKEKAFNQILYLNNKYKSTLNYFFNEENSNYPCINNKDKELLEKKIRFLSSFIKFANKQGSWCINYYSFPYIDKIIFNIDLSKAKVFFRSSRTSGGGKVYSIFDGKWKFIKDLDSWAMVP